MAARTATRVGTTPTLSMLGLDRMIRVDPNAGQLSLEAGVLLADVIAAFLQRGFFAYVVPGTRYAVRSPPTFRARTTIGGEYVVGLTNADGRRRHHARLARGERRAPPRHYRRHRLKIRLRWVETGRIRQTTFVARDLVAPMAALDASDSSTYSIARIDCIPKGLSLAACSCSLANTRLGTSCGAVRRRTPSSARRCKALHAD
jgi:hypothetical protein